LFSFSLFRLGQEDPVEEFAGYLNVVLVLPLSNCVASYRLYVEKQVIAIFAQNPHCAMSFLHTNDRSILEQNLYCVVGVSSENS